MELFTLGNLYISDFITDGQKGIKHELALVMDEDGAVKLPSHVPVNKMFGKYWYRSGTNESMRRALKDVVNSILNLRKKDSYINKQNTWLDIASNDGTLLSYVPSNYYRIGIDPCEDSFLEEARSHSDLIIQDYFSASEIERYTPRKADVITSIAVFYDIVEREKFLKDIYEVLKDDGVWVLQLSYTPLMLKQMAFDNICHEHYYYYSLFNIKKLLERNGFKIKDVQLNDVNGGSFRLYVMKDVSKEILISQPYQDVCNMRIESLLEYEKTLQLDAPLTWVQFISDVAKLSNEVRDFIVIEKAKGKKIWGYGASTKGNTLLQYFDLNNSLIDAIAERSPYKIGLKTIGTNIPVMSEEDMRVAQPDYLLILPWHFISEFIEREKEYLNKGGHFIIPCPKLKII
jgi:SAM-dependent methyltransferase